MRCWKGLSDALQITAVPSGNLAMGKRKQPISGWFSMVFRYPPISIHFTCISHVCHRFDGVPVSKWLQKPTTVPESLGASDRIAAVHKIQMRRAARSTRYKLRWPTLPPIDQGSSRAQDTYGYQLWSCAAPCENMLQHTCGNEM